MLCTRALHALHTWHTPNTSKASPTCVCACDALIETCAVVPCVQGRAKVKQFKEPVAAPAEASPVEPVAASAGASSVALSPVRLTPAQAEEAAAMKAAIKTAVGKVEEAESISRTQSLAAQAAVAPATVAVSQNDVVTSSRAAEEESAGSSPPLPSARAAPLTDEERTALRAEAAADADVMAILNEAGSGMASPSFHLPLGAPAAAPAVAPLSKEALEAARESEVQIASAGHAAMGALLSPRVTKRDDKGKRRSKLSAVASLLSPRGSKRS